MKPISYRAPTTIDGAIAALAESGSVARPLAGGTDLLVQLRRGTRSADCLVDIKRIPELQRVHFDPTAGLVVGAAVSCADLADHADVRALYPCLVDGFGIIGGTAVRNRATIGGNLCNASPSGDGIPPLIVLGARAEIAGPNGRRSISVDAFCKGPGLNALGAGELLVALHLPPPGAGEGARYLRFTPRAEMDIAIVGAAAWLRLTKASSGSPDYTVADARIALGAVGPVTLVARVAAEWLTGRAPDDDALAHTAHLAQEVACPISDVRGSRAQRVHLIGVMVGRALKGALERALERANND